MCRLEGQADAARRRSPCSSAQHHAPRWRILLQAAAAHQQREAVTAQSRQREVQQAAANADRDRASSELSERSLQAAQLEADLQSKTHEVTQLQAQLSSAHQVGSLDFAVRCLAGNNKAAWLSCMKATFFCTNCWGPLVQPGALSATRLAQQSPPGVQSTTGAGGLPCRPHRIACSLQQCQVGPWPRLQAADSDALCSCDPCMRWKAD